MPLHVVPSELVREIIHFMLSSAPRRSLSLEKSHFSTKPSWLILDALSLTSRTYRSLALEAWFRNLYLESPDDVHFIRGHFPELLAKWTRNLHCVQANGMSVSLWDLSGFRQLSAVRLDWLMSILMPCNPHDMTHGLDSLPFLDVSSTIEQLDLRGLANPSPTAFQGIPNTFPNLKVLKIQQRTVWCGSCHMCRVVRLKDPGPTKVVYEGGLGLPIHYGRILARLEHLERIIITVPNHGSGCITLTPNPDPDTNPIPHLWSGECDDCLQILHEDGFHENRVEWKMYGDGNRPPKLCRVEWHFFKADEDEGATRLAIFTDFEAMKVRLMMSRGFEQVRVFGVFFYFSGVKYFMR